MNISNIANATTKATALSNLILVTPQDVVGYQPQKPKTLLSAIPLQKQPSILFHYEGEQKAIIESDITDHYVENNSAIEDQIALKPEMVTTSGYIGELNNVPPPGLEFLKTIADKLTIVGAYRPRITRTAILAYNEAFLLYQVAANALNSAVSAWTALVGDGQSVIGSDGLTQGSNQNKQQTAFQQFYGYWRKKTLFTVQTPWAVFEDMAISRLEAIQDGDTRMITDFRVTFKLVRFADSIEGNLISAVGRAATQAAKVVDQGTSTPASSTSLSDGLSGMGAQ